MRLLRACTSWQRPATESSAGVRCRPPAAAAAFPRSVAVSKNAATCGARAGPKSWSKVLVNLKELGGVIANTGVAGT